LQAVSWGDTSLHFSQALWQSQGGLGLNGADHAQADKLKGLK
jgi:hypothetical protein